MVHVEESFEIFRLTIFVQQICFDQSVGMRATALVRHHYLRVDVPVFRVGSIALYRFKFRKRLETIFAEKAAACFVVAVDRFFGMPYVPIMTIVAAAVITGKRRRGPIKTFGSIFLNDFGKRHVILIGKLLPYPLLVLRILLGISPLPSPVEPGIIALIVTAPKGDTSMIAQALYVVDRFLADIFKKFAFGRIKAACEHEILPNQYTILVAKIIEEVVFVNTSSPDAQHIHIGIDCVENGFPVSFFCDAWQKIVLRNVIGAFCKNGLPV